MTIIKKLKERGDFKPPKSYNRNRKIESNFSTGYPDNSMWKDTYKQYIYPGGYYTYDNTTEEMAKRLDAMQKKLQDYAEYQRQELLKAEEQRKIKLITAVQDYVTQLSLKGICDEEDVMYDAELEAYTYKCGLIMTKKILIAIFDSATADIRHYVSAHEIHHNDNHAIISPFNYKLIQAVPNMPQVKCSDTCYGELKVKSERLLLF